MTNKSVKSSPKPLQFFFFFFWLFVVNASASTHTSSNTCLSVTPQVIMFKRLVPVALTQLSGDWLHKSGTCMCVGTETSTLCAIYLYIVGTIKDSPFQVNKGVFNFTTLLFNNTCLNCPFHIPSVKFHTQRWLLYWYCSSQWQKFWNNWHTTPHAQPLPVSAVYVEWKMYRPSYARRLPTQTLRFVEPTFCFLNKLSTSSEVSDFLCSVCWFSYKTQTESHLHIVGMADISLGVLNENDKSQLSHYC